MSCVYNSIGEVEDAFIRWLVDLGIPPESRESLKLDGQKRRYRIKGDRAGERNGEYRVIMDDRPAGYAKSYSAKHSVEYETWAYQKAFEIPWTPEERRKYFEERQKIGEAEKREAELARARAVARAVKKWESGTDHDPKKPHPYIMKKNLAGTYGTRVLGTELLIPGYGPGGEILTVQTVDLKREPQKKFMEGTQKHGTFFVIGATEFSSPSGREVFVCEGFATGATIYEATGRTVVVAWDRGNLLPVVSALRARYPGRLIVAPDNDRKTVGNPGMAAAFEILEAFGIPFVMPEFAEGEQGSDWNDYAALHDIERTAEAIFTALDECRKNPDLQKHFAGPNWISTAKSGAPLGTKENLEVLLECHDIRVWYDEIKKDTRYELPDSMNGNKRFGADNAQNSTLAVIVSLCESSRYPTEHLSEYLAAIADENRMNPVRQWILSRTWDKKDRVEALCETLQTADGYPEEMKRTLVRRWLVSAVAASFSRGVFKSRGVLVLQGKQGLGKTSWFAGLVPPDSGWFLDGVALNPDEKDSLKKVVSHWIIELGELDATFKRADISKLKSFITSTTDVVRLPWARKFSEFPRRTVFCASVNQADFLVDTTGNSRWWGLPCRRIDFRHGLDMQQLWAQVWHIYNDEKIWWLTPEEEELNRLNRYFEASDEIEDLIATKWDWDKVEDSIRFNLGGWLNATTVLKICGLQNPTKVQVRRAGEVLRALTGREPKRMGKAGSRCYWVPNQ